MKSLKSRLNAIPVELKQILSKYITSTKMAKLWDSILLGVNAEDALESTTPEQTQKKSGKHYPYLNNLPKSEQNHIQWIREELKGYLAERIATHKHVLNIGHASMHSYSRNVMRAHLKQVLAVKKQLKLAIPQYIISDGYGTYYCPRCNESFDLGIVHLYKYCPECGQRLSWEDPIIDSRYLNREKDKK